MNKNVKNLVRLAVGIVIAIVFLALPTETYEAVKFFDGGYSNELYNQGLYQIFVMIVTGVSWAVCIIYYYVIDSVKFDRPQHWLIMLLVSTLASVASCFAYNQSVFVEYNLSYTEEMVQMALCHAMFAVIMFVVATFAIRAWSSNCRHSPF